jgi:hypothetical protein
MIAAGVLDDWEAELAAITSVDTRRVLDDTRSWQGWLRERSARATGIVMSEVTLGRIYDEIPDRVYDPVIRDQTAISRPPFVENAAVVEGALTCNTPGTGFTVMVYRWNSATREWPEIGTLAEHSQPGVGYYVLVNRSESGSLGLPTRFLAI